MGKKGCVIHQCQTISGDKDVSFHKLPTDDKLRGEWIHFIQICNGNIAVTENTHLCSRQFRSTCFSESEERRRLKTGHTPSMFRGEEVAHCLQCPPLISVTSLDEITGHCHCGMEDKVKDLQQQLDCSNARILTLEKELSEAKDKTENDKGTILTTRNEVRVLKQKIKRRDDVQRKKRGREIEDIAEPDTAAAKKSKSEESIVALQLVDDIKGRFEVPRTGVQYTPLLRDFAFQLNYYSTRAYEFVRTSFNNALPHPNNFPLWSDHVQTKPGFLPSALDFLRKRQRDSPHRVYYALSFDEMSIRKQLVSDGSRLVGFVDTGDIATMPETHRSDVAEKALFLVVSEINGSLRIPIGYMLTKRVSAELLRQMITNALIKMDECEVTVLTITFDGPKVHFASMELLESSFDVEDDDFSPYLLHPISGAKVYMIPDPVHMLKLLRNALRVYREFSLGEKTIAWNFLRLLVELQTKEGLKAANKLSTRHVNFEAQKMKVSLASQTFSNSVAIALLLCLTLGLPQFMGSEATTSFLKLIDRLFDVLNSRPMGKGIKAPLRPANKKYWNSIFSQAREALLELRTKVKEKKKGKVTYRDMKFLHSPRGTAAKGLLTCIRSLQLIMADIEEGRLPDLKFIPGFKLCQDVIELFFSSIRSRFGRNNNPNAVQLAAAVRKILCMKMSVKISGNCEFEEFDTRVSPLGNIKKLADPDINDYDLEFESEDDEFEPPNLSLFGLNIVLYIAGAVGKILRRDLKCATCVTALLSQDVESIKNRPDGLLLKARDNGGLTVPSEDLIRVCRFTEEEIRSSSDRNLKKITICKAVMLRCCEPGIFDDLRTTVNSDHTFLSTHPLELIKAIVDKYCVIRLRHSGKEATLKVCPKTNRNSCTNAVQQSGN